MSYVIDPLAPFPKHWTDKHGDRVRVMCEPVEGYVLARKKGAMPFALSVRDILGSSKYPHHLGPFQPAGRKALGERS